MELQESFISYLQYEKRCSSHTIKAYKNDLDQFVEFCTNMVGEFNVIKVDSKLVREWIVSLMNHEVSARSVNRKITTLKSFFKHLIKLGVVGFNPAKGLALPKIRKKLPSFVEEDKLIVLLDNGYFDNDFIGTRDKLIVTLFYGTGIRLSELIGLKESDVDRRNSQIKVLGKRNKERIIPYPVSINQLIEQYVILKSNINCESTEAFFITEKGTPVYEKLVYRLVTQNLSKVTLLEKKSPHVLRHTYATHLLNNGADLNAVKELLGHSNLAATQIYTHTTFKKLHDIYKQAHPRG